MFSSAALSPNPLLTSRQILHFLEIQKSVSCPGPARPTSLLLPPVTILVSLLLSAPRFLSHLDLTLIGCHQPGIHWELDLGRRKCLHGHMCPTNVGLCKKIINKIKNQLFYTLPKIVEHMGAEKGSDSSAWLAHPGLTTSLPQPTT